MEGSYFSEGVVSGVYGIASDMAGILVLGLSVYPVCALNMVNIIDRLSEPVVTFGREYGKLPKRL
jgi:hypothetical protein